MRWSADYCRSTTEWNERDGDGVATYKKGGWLGGKAGGEARRLSLEGERLERGGVPRRPKQKPHKAHRTVRSNALNFSTKSSPSHRAARCCYVLLRAESAMTYCTTSCCGCTGPRQFSPDH
jgi:hypothetical protein